MAEVIIDITGRDNFSNVLGNFGSIITGIESAINLAGRAFTFFKDQALAGLDAIASYERMSTSIETLLAVELVQHDAAVNMAAAYEVAGLKAEEYLKWIQELAIHSPFTQEGVALAFRQGLAFGFTSEETQRLTEATINYVAATGQQEHVMTSLMRIMGQIDTAGKLLGQDWNQLASIGIPVADILAEHFGVTKEEIIAMRSDGLLPATEVLEALTVWMETNFAGAADRFTQTWAGLLGTFEDLKQMGLREFFGGLYEALQPLAIEFAEWLQGPGMEKLREWGTTLGEITGNVVNFALAIKDFFGLLTGHLQEGVPLLEAIGLTLKEIGYNSDFVSNLNLKIKEWGDLFLNAQAALENFIAAISPALFGFGSFFTQFISDTGPNFKGLFTEIIGLLVYLGSEMVPVFIENFNKIGMWFRENGPEIAATINTLITFVRDDLIPAIQVLWQFLEPILNGLANVTLDIGDLLLASDWEGTETALSNIFGDIGQALYDALSAVWDDIFGEGSLDRLNEFEQNMAAIPTNIKAWWNDLIEYIKAKIEWMITGAREWVFNLVETVVSKILEIKQSIADALGDFVSGIFDALGIDQDAFLAQWRQIFEDVVLIVTTIKDRIVEKLSEIWDGIIESAQTALAIVAGALSAVFQPLFDILAPIWDEVVDTVLDVANIIGDAFEYAWFKIKETAYSIWRSIFAPVIEETTETATTISDILTDAWEYVSFRISNWIEIGRNVVRGIISGILEKAGEIITTITNKIQETIDKVKEKLGIASPSTVFKNIGIDIIQGLWDGMKSLWGSFSDWILTRLEAIIKVLDPRTLWLVATTDLTLAQAYQNALGGTSIGGATSVSGGRGTMLPTDYYSSGGTTATMTGGTSIVNNFYGNVYVGTMEELYDCPSPHPLLTATAGQITAIPAGTIGGR